MTGSDSRDGDGERIARRMARAGVASRRTAEAMIAGGRVTVNGRVIDSPALNVTSRDQITVDGAPLAAPEAPRLWRYYKPIGLVTSERDEKGRETVFSRLPQDMPRVVSIGRLDLNSEGLLLLTNDGALKRRLELPSTGWLRKYRVRAHGEATDATLEPLRRGISVDGERFQPMTVTVDRQQGSNVWLSISLREGKNREVRRALDAVGLSVNRLIRVSYGPFQLGELEPGQVEEVRAKAVREQLGLGATAQRTAADRRMEEPTERGQRTAGPAATSRGAGKERSGTGAPVGARQKGLGQPASEGSERQAEGRTAKYSQKTQSGRLGARADSLKAGGRRGGADADGATSGYSRKKQADQRAPGAGYSQKSQAGRLEASKAGGKPARDRTAVPDKAPATKAPGRSTAKPPRKPLTPGSRKPK